MAGGNQNPAEGFAWWRTDGRLDTLRRLWNDTDTPASKIAAELGCSKNAVVGQARRSELRLRRAPPDIVRPISSAKAAIENLHPHDCRWPIGHPGNPEFHFCGSPVVSGDIWPYCKKHKIKAKYNREEI